MCHETVMARTKKQTLVNACERRRQIQEEILRESLAAKPKKESLSLATENPEAGSANPSHNGVTTGEAAGTPSQAEGSAGHSDISRGAARVIADCSDPASIISMSAWSPPSGPASTSLTEGNLPKAVICITDICRSPTKLPSDDHQDCKEAGVKSQGAVSKSSDGHHLKSRDNHSRRHNSSLRQQEETPSHEGVVASLRSLRASSDKVREEKSNRRTRSEHSSASCQTPHSRHSSARQGSPATPVANHSLPRKGNRGSRSPVEEKPKINIFTDSIGVDLGKRIRSPRRLSDDMIALPIFSARKWGNSPKEMSASFCGRSAEEATFVEGVEASSAYNVSCQSFKSPVVSPKKSSPVSLSVKASASSMGQSHLPDNQLSDISLADSDCSSVSLYNGSQTDPFDSESESCMSSSKALARRICESVNASQDAHKFKRVNQKSDHADNSDGSCQPPSESDTRDSMQNSAGLAARAKCANDDKLRSKAQGSPEKSELKAEISSLGVQKSCENICLSQKYECGVSDWIETPMETDCGSKCDEERKVIKDSCNSSLNNSSGEEFKCENSCSGHFSTSSHPDKDEKPQSSLLCAMLIGGTEVAHSYNRERMKTRPHSMESSDSDLDLCKHKMESQASQEPLSEQHDADVSMVKLDLTSTVKKNDLLLVEVKTEKPDAQFDACDFIHLIDHTCNNKQLKSEHGEQSSASYNLKPRSKKSPLNLTSQLKKLNEDVFRLLEIGGAEGSQQNQTSSEEIVDKEPCESKTCEQKFEMELPETALYNLISTLGNRLRDSSSNTDCSAPGEVTLVDKLMESCPKKALSVCPKIKTMTSQVHINLFKDLKEHVKEDIKDESILSLNISSPEKKEILTTLDKGQKHVVLDSDVRKDTISVADLLSVSTNKLIPTSCQQEKDCGDIKDTFVAACGNFDIRNKNEPSESHASNESEIKLLCDVIGRSQVVLESGARHSFQKSKTCDDFNDRLCSEPVINERTLRRVNSSPQINIKSLISHVSPSSPTIGCSKDIQNKSKLGSRIPIPGTSYYTKSRKTWRIPRVVMEPKPLSVLSTLEDKSSLPSNIFTCQNLQKYLNIPSNRIIMTPDRIEEMKMLDAKAKQAEEMIDRIKMESDENIKKMDEEREINADFVKFEPDFDEVDGVLFMSFSSEIELQAHVKVEKALQWDRDDTMLKVSQAKAFEEAKALNEDMGHFKLKHLRGQHMRWKKYRRLYTREVKSLLAVYGDLKSHGDSLSPKKTSDVSKIKGWKKKLALAVEADTSWLSDFPNASHNDIEDDLKFFGDMGVSEDDMNCLNESLEEGDKSRESRRAKRLQAFSRQKEHRQLFRELKMDWEDRMIHRKLGGWSLKGNRPVAFSSAAKKRKEKMSKDIEPVSAENKEHNPELFLFEEAEAELSEIKDASDCMKKKKPVRIFYPLLTEKMARNALKAMKPLEAENTSRPRPSRKKVRQDRPRPPVRLPSLTPVVQRLEPLKPKVSDLHREVKNISPATSLSTPSASASMRTLHSSSGSAGTATQEADMQDEPVMEGVDIASENISSPSVTDTSSIKSCSKPGCRYGCICHLCSVSETSVPQPNPVTKQPRPVCDKEYCRLGCICDSLDSDKSVSEKNHCRRPSCMLECVCPESGSLYGNDDIPYLPSMRRRPTKPGDRFSNLPQREKTHRTAKNLDAVTRKAMMLYETSEIYCERVERSKKRIEADAGGSMAGADDLLHTPTASDAQVYCDVEIVGEERPPQTISLLEGDDPVVSVAPAYSSSSGIVTNTGFQQIQHQPRTPAMRMAGTAFVFNDVRHIVASMEPSAHKRKRKSHPLSDEIFTSYTCARAQPFRYTPVPKEAPTTTTSVMPASVSEASRLTFKPSLPTAPVPGPPSAANNETSSALPIITNVKTLAPMQGTDSHQWESGETEPSLPSPAVTCASALGANQGSSASQPKTFTNLSTASVTPASSRQFHGWHKSMVCLKARAPPSSQDLGEDDVKEEDEVKLLEFAANCNWEGAKREILARVAQCLTRGQYPQPRTMNVCEFVVEILPKAHHPSQIPPELRSKLPGQMYSIRVRITRRESVRKIDDNSDVIDLSVSPVKSRDATTSPTEDISGNASDPSFKVTPSVGISGLRKYFITNSNGQQTLSNGKENLQFQGVTAVSAPISRRSSTESLLAKSFLEDPKKSLEPAVLNVMTPPSVEPKSKSPSFLHLATGSNVPASSSVSVTTTPASSGGSKKMAARPVKTQSLLTKQVPAGVAPIFGPFNDVRYMIPGKDGTMQVIEMGARLDKNKKLIAVPITVSKTVDLKGKQNSVMVPVGGIGQKRMVPLLSPQAVTGQLKSPAAQPMLLRLPGTSPPTPLMPGVRQPVVLQPMKNSVKGQPQRFQVVPLQLGNCMTMSQAKVISAQTAHGFKSVAATAAASKPSNSCNEKTLDGVPTQSIAPGSSQTSASSVDTGQLSDKLEYSIVVTDINGEPFLSPEPSPAKHHHPNKCQSNLSNPFELLQAKESSGGGQDVIADFSDTTTKLEMVDLVKEEVIDTVLCDTSDNIFFSDNHPPSENMCFKDEVSNLVSISKDIKAESPNTLVIDDLPAVKEEILTETELGSDVPFESAIVKTCDSPIPSANTYDTECRPTTEPIPTGSKRQAVLEEPLSVCPSKKPCLVSEHASLLDEDSLVSLNNSFSQQQPVVSPLSSVDRPKSVMSSALSTGSSDDLFVLMSSDEEVDVGEDERPDEIISYRMRAERALENDHGYLNYKSDLSNSDQREGENVKTKEHRHDEASRFPEKGRSGGRNFQRAIHHNQLERLRRSRMRLLFDDLQKQVLQEMSLPKEYLMSKVKVLVEAKSVILSLNQEVREGGELIHKLERQHKALLKQLAILKGGRKTQDKDVALPAPVVMKKSVSEKSTVRSRDTPDTSLVAEMNQGPLSSSSTPITLVENQEIVNLVSPSTEEDKSAEEQDVDMPPVYEDISDPEDGPAHHSYEDISDVEDTLQQADSQCLVENVVSLL